MKKKPADKKPLKRNFVFLTVDLEIWRYRSADARIELARELMRSKSYHSCYAFSVPREPNKVLIRVTRDENLVVVAQACGISFQHPLYGASYKPLDKSRVYTLTS